MASFLEKHDNLILKHQRLGDILIRRTMVTRNQLSETLKKQKEEKQVLRDCPGIPLENNLLGEILVRNGFLEEKDILAALVVQSNVPYIAVDKYEIDPSVLSLISKSFMRKFNVVPLDCVGEILSVVMVDPFDKKVMAQLYLETNCRIAPFISTKVEVKRAIKKWIN